MMTDRRISVMARRTAAAAVATAFMPMEKSAEATAAHGANCIAVMLEQRAAAKLGPDVGADALVLISEATTKALQAHRDLARAHAILLRIPGEQDIPAGYGPDCAPNQPFETTGLVRSA